MTKQKILILFFLSFVQVSAQNNAKEFVNDTGIENIRNYFSTTFLERCYSSEKVNKLIPKKEIFNPIVINESDFNSLNAYEHFIHSFYFPEWYYQSCSMFGFQKDVMQTIPSNLIREGEGLIMSVRQRKAINENRDSTIILMRNCVLSIDFIHDDFKRCILNLRAYELIPDIITVLNKQTKVKDPYALSTLCLLMQFEYEPFINSEIYNQLYPSDSLGYADLKQIYKHSIPFTYENYNIIIQFAQEYYKYKSHSESEFVKILSGKYSVGETGHSNNPLRKVNIPSFHISRYEITNYQFNIFIKNTGYITTAEKNKDAFVFRLGLNEFEWIQDSTANWKYPNGITEGGIENKMNHPVTCISYKDAVAYCNWANVRLPTIDEWEIASRGNNFTQKHFFGDSVDAIHQFANIWHGKTHLMKYDGEDFITTSPVGSFKPNPIGLYDIYGNVFEFCSDIPTAYEIYPNIAATRGGSWWCSLYACGFFNSVDIGRVQKEASFSNNGFRVIL